MKLDSLYVRESTQFKLGHCENQIRPLADSKRATDEKRRSAEYDRRAALVGRGRALKSRQSLNQQYLCHTHMTPIGTGTVTGLGGIRRCRPPTAHPQSGPGAPSAGAVSFGATRRFKTGH